MSVGSSIDAPGNSHYRTSVPFFSIAYRADRQEESVKQIVQLIRPQWFEGDAKVKLMRCTDGITNTLLKVTLDRPGLSHTSAQGASKSTTPHIASPLYRSCPNETSAIASTTTAAQESTTSVSMSAPASPPSTLSPVQSASINAISGNAVTCSTSASGHDTTQEIILLRAYGHGTHVLIDREREAWNHEVLMHHGLAPELLARFENGMLYRYIHGTVTTPEDLRRPEIAGAVARRLAEWHATVACFPPTTIPEPVARSHDGAGIASPATRDSGSSIDGSNKRPSIHKDRSNGSISNGQSCTPGSINKARHGPVDSCNGIPERSPSKTNCGGSNNNHGSGSSSSSSSSTGGCITTGKPEPNLWTVTQKWINALPNETVEQKAKKVVLQSELEMLVKLLSQRPGLGDHGLVFAHCDLLHGNIIIEPAPSNPRSDGHVGGHLVSVNFIDYEYATPSPAAFDIANHFAEWAGFECDYSMLPTRSQRMAFIREYVKSYFDLLSREKQQKKPRAYHDIITTTTTTNGDTRVTSDDADARRAAEGFVDLDSEAQRLFAEIDLYRGIPGFYWGIWAAIQAEISEIDFDYASYSDLRLDEYWAWKAEFDGRRVRERQEMPLREMRWAEE